ncbi:multicopper oxidase family protein [Azotosporobacter soli]|uniref:multicopper oxidase family protein n=1 Tax=Azotosporobacter soli TaxID=3055040 RepID=UPI0031FE75FE
MKKAAAILVCWLGICGAGFAESIANLDMTNVEKDLGNGSRVFWLYGNTLPGPTIVCKVGESITIRGVNGLTGHSNIHWHGLSIPNNQDGMMKNIIAGERFSFEFTPEEAGTYWYHSFKNPMAQQMEMGLYGAFIVKRAEDDNYQGDHTFIIGKHYGVMPSSSHNPNGIGLLINGQAANGVTPLMVKTGDVQKVRFINAMTEGALSIKMTGHLFRVTHMDGYGVFKPYETGGFELWPGERIDAEIKMEGKAGERYELQLNDRTIIPILYEKGGNSSAAYVYVPESMPDWLKNLSEKNDYTLTFAEGLGEGMRQWNVNGKSFPDTDLNKINVGQVVRLRLWNTDATATHVIHIQGTHFLIVGENGRTKEPVSWKDTVAIPSATYIDVAFVMKAKGDWMVYCQEAKHADGGMITVLRAN